jgi:hypothetical protein
MPLLNNGETPARMLDAKELLVDYIIHKAGDINPIINEPYLITTVGIKIYISSDHYGSPEYYGNWICLPDDISNELLDLYKNYLFTKTMLEIEMRMEDAT